MKVELEFGAENRKVDVGEVDYIACSADGEPELVLDSGAKLKDVPLAYQAYGQLNEDKSNVILLCHGLTGDQYVAGEHPVTGKPGWWQDIVSAGGLIDTDRYFVICINVLGGCMGSMGPKTINPENGEFYGLDFPVITIADMVRAQQRFLSDRFGIDKIYAVIGASMGGMLTLEWLSHYPDKISKAIAIATAARHSAQNIAFHEIGRQAIMADEAWQGGKYYNSDAYPSKGLAVARMTAHVTYMSQIALHHKFGRNLQERDDISFGFEADFQVESYLRYQGKSFVDRFDANSYLYITRAMDYFDLFGDNDKSKSKSYPFAKLSQMKSAEAPDILVVSFSSDWLFPTNEAREIVHKLSAIAARVSFSEIITDRGHDAFLLDEPEFHQILSGFLNN